MPLCPFYTKRCTIVAPCCGERVCCHRCHDQDHTHKLPRNRVQFVVCDDCHHQQSISQGATCLHCGSLFAAYFCTSCAIANFDVPAEGYFHCHECGICRVGSEDEYFHCEVCNCCLRIQLLENHHHQPSCLKMDCPICHEYIFDSQSPADQLPCGHMARLTCIRASCASGSRSLSTICTMCSNSRAGQGFARSGVLENSGSSGEGCSNDAARQVPAGPSAVDRRLAQQGSKAAQLADVLADDLGGAVLQHEVMDLLTELEELDMLPTRDQVFEAGAWEQCSSHSLPGSRLLLSSSGSSATMEQCPRLFRQLLEQAICASVITTASENRAKGAAINQVVQLLQGASSEALELFGLRVTFDRIAVAGSVGKKVHVQGMFDIDLVAFMNLPACIPVDLEDPDETQNSDWMMQLKKDLRSYLQRNLPPGTMGSGPPTQNKAALTFQLPVEGFGTLEVDVLLAPNLVPLGRNGSSAAEAQCAAVLQPLLSLLDSKGTSPEVLEAAGRVHPSYVRSVWLAESATEFVKTAAASWSVQQSSLSGRVVTTTIRLVKAWVRKGLQDSTNSSSAGYKHLKAFMLELLVLHAAERFAAQLAGTNSSSSQQYGGRYVLDLLLVVLDIVQEWAAVASSRDAAEPVLFTELAGNKYYSRQQAMKLQQLLRQQDASKTWWGGTYNELHQPVVVHPIDPLMNVFNQPLLFELWREFGIAARQLANELRSQSWSYIVKHSTLGSALRSHVNFFESFQKLFK